jgi:hypothetical protein
MPYNPTEFTRSTVSEATWMDALNDIGEQEHLAGFPMSDAMLYADDRWLAEYDTTMTSNA